MTSFGDVQYPQYPQYPSAPNHNYDDVTQSRGGNVYRQAIIHEDPYTSSGSSGYGDTSPSGYGPQHYPAHSASGPSSPDYGPPVEHAPHPHPTRSSEFGGLKKGGSSAMSALTLLSFFFFVNLLQNCLKEHMSKMNPTIMVMTNGAVKHRSTKLAEMNSRESASTASESSEQVIIKPDIVMSRATTTGPPATIAATLIVAKPNIPAAENVPVLNTNNAVNSYPKTAIVEQPNLSSYDSNHNYPNQTETPSSTYTHSERYRPQHYYNDHYPSPYQEDTYPWSHRHDSRYGHNSHDSSYWDRYESRRYPNHDFYDDTSYLRIY